MKVNLYDPHADPETHINPGPGHYFDPPPGMIPGRSIEAPGEDNGVGPNAGSTAGAGGVPTTAAIGDPRFGGTGRRAVT